MDKVRTVSDTKRDFYAHHTHPINSVYRRVVEELMVEMHLLSVNVDFRPDPIYYLGVVTSFDRFMQGYKPEKDKESIFNALCHSVGGNAQEYRQRAENLLALAKSKSADELIKWFAAPTPLEGGEGLHDTVVAIANNPKFKYSRLFAIGLYTLLETADPEFLKDEQNRNRAFKELSEALHLPDGKIQKDLEIYRTNLEKMTQVLSAIDDILQADRKKREQRALEKNPIAETGNNGK